MKHSWQTMLYSWCLWGKKRSNFTLWPVAVPLKKDSELIYTYIYFHCQSLIPFLMLMYMLWNTVFTVYIFMLVNINRINYVTHFKVDVSSDKKLWFGHLTSDHLMSTWFISCSTTLITFSWLPVITYFKLHYTSFIVLLYSSETYIHEAVAEVKRMIDHGDITGNALISEHCSPMWGNVM